MLDTIPRFEHDERLIIASSIDDFALIGQDGIKGAILKNPFWLKSAFTPSALGNAIGDQLHSAILKDRVHKSISEGELTKFPNFLRETGSLLYTAYKKAGRELDTPSIQVRRDISYPIIPHQHDFVAIADVVGSTTVGYTNDDPNRPYSLPKGSIIGFEHILHKAGEEASPTDKSPIGRLLLIL